MQILLARRDATRIGSFQVVVPQGFIRPAPAMSHRDQQFLRTFDDTRLGRKSSPTRAFRRLLAREGYDRGFSPGSCGGSDLVSKGEPPLWSRLARLAAGSAARPAQGVSPAS
jgi:hypothetical protein